MKFSFKRFFSILLVVIALTQLFSFAASARASAYISSYGAGVKAKGGGTMTLDYLVNGTRISEKVGASNICFEKLKADGSYEVVSLYTNEYNYDMLGFNSYRTYTNCEVGAYYRGVVTFYVKGYDGGSDMRTYTTTDVKCT